MFVFQVPFIAYYRKEYVEPELKIEDLWRVWQFDEKVSYTFQILSKSMVLGRGFKCEMHPTFLQINHVANFLIALCDA